MSFKKPRSIPTLVRRAAGTAGSSRTRLCELVEYHLTDVDVKGAWTGPAELTLFSHALAPPAELPVVEIVSGLHIIADLALGLGKVVHDYLR
jgi:acetoacetate decarboxylase